MKLKSYSKINLSLRVMNRLKNGMHNIETNSVLVNIFDEINIQKDKKNLVIFKGKFKSSINKKKNSILKTLKILKKLGLISNYYKIIIKKNIPVFAGLGGGTGNSASIVKHFLKKGTIDKSITIFVKHIGSDFRLFLNNLSFQKSLNKVLKNKNKFPYYFVVIFPNIKCETRNIYKNNRNYRSSSGNTYTKKLARSKYIEILKRDKNDLQQIVEKKYPKISKLIKSISDQKNCIFSRLTGSGSACYGVFKSKKTAEFAMTKLKRKYPKYWCAVTKTI
tara:strand:- start:29 stop:859 length:831 start_codon:yes stop_codon:yes gene_type:complete